MPTTPYKTYTQEQWQQILQGARAAHDQAAVQDAVSALNQYEQEAVPPTTGELLGAEGEGLAEFPGQAVSGIGQMLEDLAQGHVGKAVKDVVGGLGQGISGLMALPAAALGEAGGKEYSREDLLNRARNYGSSTGAVAAMAAPGAIMRFAKGGPMAAIAGMPEETGMVKGFQPTGPIPREPVGEPVAPKPVAPTEPVSPASSTPAQPMSKPMSASSTPAFEEDMPIAQKSKWPGMPKAEIGQYLDQIAQRSGYANAGEMPAGPALSPKARMGAWANPEEGLFGNEKGFTTPENLALILALGTRLGAGAGMLKALGKIPFGRLAADATGTSLTGAALSPTDSSGIR